MKKLSLLLGIAAMLLVSISSYADTAPAQPAVDGEISNFAELLWFSTNYSASTTQDWVLTADIDAAETADWTTSYPSINEFTGTLDGQGYEIQNLTIKDDCFIVTMTGGNAHVTRLGMVNCSVGPDKTIANAGGITGTLLTNAKISKCYFVGGSVYGKTNTGGLVGRNNTGNVIIENCYVSATVSDDSGFVLGNCGGIVGNLAKASTMTNCLFFASAKSTKYPICGPAAPSSTTTATTTNCCFQAGSFNTDNSTAWSQTSIADATALGTQATYTGWDFTNIWEMDATAGHPVLRKPEREAVATAPTGWTEGAGGDITNIAELRWLSETETAWDEDWKITADINATQSADWNSGVGFSPIDTLKGSINGMGHTITGLTINSTANAGFCKVSNGNITQLGLVDCNIYTTSARAGAFAATMEKETLTRCYATGSIKASTHIGGLVGYVTGSATIENCYVAATVLKNTGSQTLGNAGGLFGTLNGSSYTVKDCYYVGTSRSPIVNNGGTDGTVTGCYYDSGASSITNTSYANQTALTSTEMAVNTNFTAWDFTNIWVIADGYPTLQAPEYFDFTTTASGGSVAGTIDGSYAAGTILRLKATPANGYVFTDWTIAGTSYSTADSINYTMPKQDLAIEANFSVATTTVETVEADWKIYPNPCNGVVTIQSAEAATISIIDLSGKVVVASTPVNTNGEVSISSLKQGIYFVKAQFEEQSELTKLIVR